MYGAVSVGIIYGMWLKMPIFSMCNFCSVAKLIPANVADWFRKLFTSLNWMIFLKVNFVLIWVILVFGSVPEGCKKPLMEKELVTRLFFPLTEGTKLRGAREADEHECNSKFQSSLYYGSLPVNWLNGSSLWSFV